MAFLLGALEELTVVFSLLVFGLFTLAGIIHEERWRPTAASPWKCLSPALSWSSSWSLSSSSRSSASLPSASGQTRACSQMKTSARLQEGSRK